MIRLVGIDRRTAYTVDQVRDDAQAAITTANSALDAVTQIASALDIAVDPYQQ